MNGTRAFRAALLVLPLLAAAATAQPGGMSGAAPPIDTEKMMASGPKGSLVIRALQGTKGGPAVGACEAQLELYHRNQPIVQMNVRLDDTGMVMVRDLPVAMAVRPLVRIKHANVLYQDVGPQMDPAHPNTAVDVTVYETTDQQPAWRINARQVLIAPIDGELDVVENLEVENTSDRTWLGAPADAEGRRATIPLTLPEGVHNVELEGGFHGWCCTALKERALTIQMPLMPGKMAYRFAYRLPTTGSAADVRVSAAAPCQELVFMIPDDGSRAELVGLEAAGTQTIQDTRVLKFQARNVAASGVAGMRLTGLTFPQAPAAPGAATASRRPWLNGSGPLYTAVGVGVLIVGGAIYLWLRAPGERKRHNAP